jgi:hypothetical protein
MKALEVLEKIKGIVGIELAEEVKLAEMKLENGTVLEAEAFEKGESVFIVSDEERIALPVGEYVLEDSRLLVIEEEGLIADIREVSDEVPAKEEEMAEETELMPEDEADVADWKGMEMRIKQLEDAIADLKADKENKVDASEEIKEEVELSTETVETPEPIKHSPEVKEEGFKMDKKNYPNTLMNRIYSKLN